MTALSTMGNH
ncbi:hypothetical protein LINPERPRIM_LOCUS30696 [Linum perenne]